MALPVAQARRDSCCGTVPSSGARPPSSSSRTKHSTTARTRARLCHPGPVLSSMRDRDGGPKVRVRVLALVVALLLGGPLTLLVLQTVARLLDRVL